MSFLSQELTTNLSALLFGNIANAVLFGLTTVQTYAYWTHRGDDPVYLVLLLLICWFIDISQLALFSLTTFTYTISHFGDAFVSTRDTTRELDYDLPYNCSSLLEVLIFLTGASDLIVRRCIFCIRIWKCRWSLVDAMESVDDLNLTKTAVPLIQFEALNTVITTTIDWGEYSREAATASTDPAMLEAFAGMSFSVSSYEVWRTTRFSALIYTGLSNAVVGDILIAASLSLILKNHLKDILSSRTSSIVRMLMAYSIETGALTSICTLACLIMYAALSRSIAYLAMYLLLSKFSLNALLATLNARRGLREVSIALAEAQSIPVFLGAVAVNDSVAS
ncbi:hypothetical protein C8Q72DRAFT_883099 [Fomitopsis betulina]|nr:hypothetical protein C8Q72DRAFT_883099 [Fomitopsis betulina]